MNPQFYYALGSLFFFAVAFATIGFIAGYVYGIYREQMAWRTGRRRLVPVEAASDALEQRYREAEGKHPWKP